MNGIRNQETFVKVESIDKGLSGDKKYYIETVDGERLLLRVSDIVEYDRKEIMFGMMKQAAMMSVPMCKPVDFGVCNDGKSVYQLLTWCDGENLETILPTLSQTKQYAAGLKAGKILRKIHSITAPDKLEDWSLRYCSQNDDRIKAFSDCGIQIENSDAILRYIQDNKHLLRGRPQCFHHGDYHTGNLMMTSGGDLSVIDWELLDYDNFADPWEEFNRIGNSQVLPHFTTGLIRGYFDGEPPEEFWRLLALYLSSGALMLVSWAFYIQNDQLEYATQHAKEILQWYDNMRNPVPTWYVNDEYIK